MTNIMLCRASRRASRRAKEEATSSSNNWEERRMGSGKNLEQVTNKEQGQILSTLEEIHSRIWHLGKKKKLRKYQKGNRRIQKGVLIRYRRSKLTRKRRGNI